LVASGDYRSRRIVLKPSAGEQEVQQFADELGWPRLDETEQEVEGGILREVAWAAGPALSLHYTEDPVSLNKYVAIWGYDKDNADALARMTESRLEVWTMDELLNEVENATSSLERAKAVIRAGVGAPDDYDERFFLCISSAMSDPDTRVRETGLYATAYASYPAYRPKLRQVAQEDPDPQRRDDAEVLLESFDIEGVPEP
jgi:hypothetical protein